MGLAETAQLAVRISLQDQLSPGIAKMQGQVSGIHSSFGNLVGSAARAESGISRLGGAMGHAKNQVTGLLTGPLGIIGLTGGLFSLGGIVESSLRHTSDFGLGLEKLTALTGESAQAMGGLLITYEKFGIGADQAAQFAGFAEKTLGKLAETQGKVGKSAALLALEHQKLSIQLAGGKVKAIDLAIAHQKEKDALAASAAGVSKLTVLEHQYGISLRDTTGHVVNYTTELSRIADYYNSNHTAGEKAALAATLLGRGYAAQIPILKLGSKGIADLALEAHKLGLELGQTNVNQINDYRSSIRDLGASLGILQLSIGVTLIPAVKGLADSLTGWLKDGGAAQITDFFRKGADFAQQFGSAIQHFVVPVFGLITSAWAQVPGPLKDLLIGGFVVNKAGKFLFNKSLVGGLTGSIKGLFEGVLGRVPGLGKVVGIADPGMRVFVTNFPVGFGGGGLLPTVGGALAGGGGAGIAAIVALAAVPLIPLVAAYFLAGGDTGIATKDLAGRQATAAARGLDPTNVPTDMGPGRRSPITAWAAGRSAADIAEAASQIRNATRFDQRTRADIAEAAAQIRNATHGFLFATAGKAHNVAIDRQEKASQDRNANFAPWLAKSAADLAEIAAQTRNIAHRPSAAVALKAGSVSVSTIVNVAVTAAGIAKTVTTQARYGPASGSRDTRFAGYVPGL